jgi:WD40 repeat protein
MFLNYKYLLKTSSSSIINSFSATTAKTELTLNILTYQSVFIDKELFGSDSQVKSLVVLKDQSIASASNGEIKLWSSVDDSLLRTIDSGHIINSMIVMEDGVLISAGLDARIIIWNVTIGFKIRVLKGHFKAIYCLAVLNEENFASGSADTSIIIWNSNTGQQLKKLKETNCWVWSLAALDKHKLAFASYDHNIKIFDINSNKESKQLIGHQSEVTCLLELTDNRLASGSADSSIRIWDTQKAIALHELKGHTETVSSLVLLKDGITLISASLDATIRMWDIKTGQLIKIIERKLENKPQEGCLALALLEDGRLISGWEDKSVIIWQLKSIQ